MPKVKINAKARETRSGFEPYDGPTPKVRGIYRANLKKMTYGPNNSGSTGFNMVFELEAQKGDPKDHARFDGYPLFSRSIITESSDGSPLKEGAQRNLENLLAALGVKDDPDLIIDEGDGQQPVKKVGGKNPVGTIVALDVVIKPYEGENRPEIGSILPFKEAAVSSTKASVLDDEDEDDEDDLLEDEADEADETDGDEASEYDERADELDHMQIPALKKLARELGLPVGGKKEDLVTRILDAEFSEEDDEDEDDSPAVLDDEDDSEEIEDEEDEDEIEEEEDEEADRRAELAEIDRNGLKKILHALDKDFAFKKSHTEADLIEEIISREFEDETPF